MIELPASPTFENLRLPHRRRSEFSSANHRFVQSISTFVFPSHRSSNGAVEFTFAGSDECRGSALSLLQSIARHSLGVTPSICEAGNEIASILCASGELSYEAISSNEVPVLHLMNPRSTRRVFAAYYSLFRSADEYGQPKFGPKMAAGARFWLIRLPPKLGGTRGHKKLLELIDEIGEFAPAFRMKALNTDRYDIYDGRFSHEHYRRAYIEFITAATCRWGWAADSSYAQYSTEYFWLRRWIVSIKAKIVLRDHIVACMNSLFKNLGLSARISMIAGRTVEDCEMKLEGLESGTITTESLLDWLRDTY